MSKLFLFNPNTTASMTQAMVPAAEAVLPQGWSLDAEQAQSGPESIEGYFDEALCIPPMLARFQGLDQEGYAAAIIACFDDTGLDAARCLVDVPVVGLCQASCITASQLAGSFAIITTLERSVPALQHIVDRYGYSGSCKAVLASDIPVLDLELPGSGARKRLFDLACIARDQHKAEAIVLGCAGMVDLAEDLQNELGIPVIEPVSAAVVQALALGQLGAKTSKAISYQSPRAKKITGWP